jgi:hypothetical protein
LGSENSTWKYGTNALQNICAVMFCPSLRAVRLRTPRFTGHNMCVTEHNFLRKVNVLPLARKGSREFD